MKTFEKMILCCIWICIAIVMVLIKDQIDLNQKIEEQSIETPAPLIKENVIKIVLDEVAAVNFICENISILDEADLQFYEDGTVELSVSVTQMMIDEVKKRVDSEVVDLVLPVLKGTEISCRAELSSALIDVKGCQAGAISVPDSLMSIMNEKVNEMWINLVESRGISEIEVREEGILVTLQQE